MYGKRDVDTELIIKSCPFCGSKVAPTKHYNGYSEWYVIQCFNCHVSQVGNSYHSLKDAVDNWNKRIYESKEEETAGETEKESFDCQSY